MAEVAVIYQDGNDVNQNISGATTVGGNIRQIVVLGDPNTPAGQAGVDATYGVAVDVKRIMGGIYNASVPSISNGARSELQLDSFGNIKSVLASGLAGEDLNVDVMKVEQRFTLSNYAALTAGTVIKSAPGFLHSITFNTKGATANILTVYDNTAASGTKIATIDTTDKIGTLFFDGLFNTGLTIVLAAGTSADITVAWR